MTFASVLYTLSDSTFAAVCRGFGLNPAGNIGEAWTVVTVAKELERLHVTLRMVLEGLTDIELVILQRIVFVGEPLAWRGVGTLAKADRDHLIELIENHPEHVRQAR